MSKGNVFGRAAAVIGIAAVLGGAYAYWYLEIRHPSLPPRPMRIGFEANVPFQIRTATGFSGLAVDVVNEAARRSGIRLQWVETGTSSEEAIRKGLVDLWPVMADIPERRGIIHMSKGWLFTSHVFLHRAAAPVPGAQFNGRVAMIKLPLLVRMLRRKFPGASAEQVPDLQAVARLVCTGEVAAGMMEKRTAMMALQDPPPECAGVPLSVQTIPNLSAPGAIGSTYEAARVADILRGAIGRMYDDGGLETIVARYSFFGLEESWDTYELLEDAERSEWMAWFSAAVIVALCLILWQRRSLRQRKRVEHVLRESEERFRAIFQQAGVGVAQIGLEGNVELANDRYYEVVGHSRAELRAKGTSEITHREDLQQQLTMLPRLLKGEIQSFSTEKRYTREDGSIVWAEVCKSLVRDANGGPKYFIAVVKDITERKIVEGALKESEQRFRNMADSAPVLIWISGPDGSRTFFNKSWLEFTGRTIEQELGGGWLVSVHPDDREQCLSATRESSESRGNFHVEYRLLRKDGEYRCVLDRGVVRFPAGSGFAGHIGSCTDITDLKQSYEQHLAAQKLESLGVLAGGVAHDFNNLLGAILVRAESAQSELPEGSPAAEDLEQVRVTALRAAEIVSRLMTFARQENAPATFVDLSSIVAENVGLLKVSISKAAVLKTELSEHLPPIYANAAELHQVIMNLVLNASEALDGRAGTIAITTSPLLAGAELSPGVLLEVRDNGNGMTEDVKARIFDPFFTTRFTGRGLGLSATLGIVRRHGGVIEVESEPGKGSRFTVFLPCDARQTESGPPGVAEAAPVNAGVLLVEDEESLRTVVAKCLRRENFRVLEAADGDAAILSLKTDPESVGLVLLDVTLPGTSGVDLLDALYAINPRLRVIVSTAYSRERAMSEYGNRDVWGFIGKPYRVGDLVKLLQKAAGTAPQQSQSDLSAAAAKTR